MSSDSELASQTALPETNVDDMKTNAKRVMEKAVAATQKRSHDVTSEDSNSLVDNSADDDSNSNLAKNGSRTKKLRISREDNGDESQDVEDEDNDEADEESEDDLVDNDDVGEYDENGSVPANEDPDLADEDDTNGGVDAEDDECVDDD